MRIGITCYPSHGGSGVVATELGKLLAEKGHDIHFITYDMPFRLGNFHQNIRYHGVEANRYAVFKYPPYDLSLASRMAQVAKTYDLDLLHVHYAVPHAIAAVLAKQMVGENLKVVTTLHGTDITVLGEDPSLRDIICFGIRQSDAVTAVSEDLAKQTKSLFCQDYEKRIDCIYNFVDTRVYYPRDVSDLRKKYVDPDEKLLLHISNFRPVKRPMDVIEIFRKVSESVPARLLMVGEGPELPRVIDQVKQWGMEDRVIFLGKQDEVSRLISLADLVLLPSAKESFGLVILEAMACGVPAVASDAGGIPEVVEHGKTGFLSPVGAVDEMAGYAVQLLQDPEMHDSFAKAGLQRARTVFSGMKIVEQYEEIYRRVING
ncbi:MULTISPECIES: N-acetyl-alpha-D-glucosaminyl L-malate synthase BshA [Thermoactinomyces]|jgi:L-malate glycosyltransferase|uniref:N-acetyl-alpha-D-glucosaminyl L-malate synthase BshA n=1 Tax=Thermoactinomyces vulgaris TaxID=2026 RepID=A0ABS0QEY8_THEVU|nr:MULTISPECIES: N-acetyl-alpha-D-glucosaminyl L-malate synthase BshA [Thermoactinomyces]KYQ87871.1 N-acetyl-alpha-D-glucosaminyl L-malate synthase BshA [Thermoactinomyces sp. AS95]MBA4550453.1 N-acetyl-alpha-D-glucosaminyl L-malate synthase BshA [Thermoactinomyces vulgaris]MBA4595864.1 N-acetyl-alpha-D-glucosaminyl L-malate synthase BshA [Thermoactinomyces vulgaris]MBH8582337.1 N-acetyl-alpha-D-glucosaminyl L-malate synthase BshA [Thermoactinomyces sp. CICC 10735]MBH8584867.1 N-acetyl-alpha-D